MLVFNQFLRGNLLLGVLVAMLFLSSQAALATNYQTGKSGRFSNLIESNYVQGLRNMTKELTSVMMSQVSIIGMMIDAKQHLEVQQHHQRLMAEAHKDYHPSDTMCRFGTFVRSVASTEAKGDFDKTALDREMLSIFTNKVSRTSGAGVDADMQARIEQFKKINCDIRDNNNGLGFMCRGSKADPDNINRDVDYARTVDHPLSLKIDYSDGEASPDEMNLSALARHLYWPSSLESLKDENALFYNPENYQEARRLISMQTVAYNSFSNIVAQKAEAAPDDVVGEGNAPFIKALLRDFGLKDEEIHEELGDYPSYYAQMDVLTKKMYQSPDFYTNLYDKPVNVRRISATMEAIDLMQARDQYKSSLRRGMLLSMLIEQEIAKKASDISADFADF